MITSLDNKKVKEWTKLHQKKYRQGSYLLLDEELVRAAFENGHLETLIYTGDKPFEFENSYEVTVEVMAKISRKEGCSFIGVGRMLENGEVRSGRILILDDLQDPLNIGRIFESAVQFGFETVVMSKNSADFYHEKALRASKGAVFELSIIRTDLLEMIPSLKEMGYTVYATGLSRNTRFLHEIEPKEKMAFILGNEGSGVSKEVFDLADEIVKIDMHNIDSLNVAMAGSIVMYAFNSSGR